MIPIIYNEMCPNCNKKITSERLLLGVCENCLKEKKFLENKKVCEKLKKNNKLLNLKNYCNYLKEYEKFNVFLKKLNVEFLSIQKLWSKRVIKNKSFSITVPTGVGKSFFGILMSLYLSYNNKKSYIILPTTLLVKQTYEKINNFIEKNSLNVKIVFYHSELSKKQKSIIKEKILSKDYDILITTTNFLSKNDINDTFDFIFVDDVESLLKNSKNIDKTLKLLGFDKKIILEGYKIISLIKNKKYDLALKKREVLKKKIQRIKHGTLIVASATGKSYGSRVKLYRELLDFEIGYGSNKIRDVIDLYEEKFSKKKILEYVKILKSGIIIFVSLDYGLEKAKEIEEYLLKKGVKAKLVHSKDKKGFELFKQKKVDVLIGVASYYGVLVRGLDVPEITKYALFYGIPKFKIKLEDYLKILEEKGKLKEKINIKNKFEVESILKELNIKNFVIKKEKEEYYFITPDIKTYIQASGRTSRMTSLGLTKGLSIIFSDEKKLLEYYKKYIFLMYENELKKAELEEIKKIAKKIELERKKLESIKNKNFNVKQNDVLKTIFMIVESPNKARTIANFFGKPSIRIVNDKKVYEIFIGNVNLIITATKGHLFDLSKEEYFYGVKIEKDNFIPVYNSIKKFNSLQLTDKKEVEELIRILKSKNLQFKILDSKKDVEVIRNISEEADKIFISTDIDVEGEKIGYDVFLNITFFNKNIVRKGFNEITRKAILEAINSKEEFLDENKVKSQIVRRIEDRWIGFKLSQKLWREFNNTSLSAGRVQTPVLGWIIKRSEEHKIKIDYLILKLEENIIIKKVYEKNFDKEKFKIKTKIYEKSISPKPPFNTNKLLEESTKKLYYTSEETMSLAQELFELGLITYHRTTSTRVSKEGMKIAKEYLEYKSLKDYYKKREYYSKGAHECIRPTKPLDLEELKEYLKEKKELYEKITFKHLKLYDLIFKRFIASQMKEAKVEYEEILIEELNEKIEGYTKIIFYGWSKIYDLNLKKLSKIKKDYLKVLEKKVLKLPKVELYTEGEVVSLMKNKGIGRPSTYAQIIKKLVEKKYVLRIKNKLVSTKLGKKVYNYLTKNYNILISESRTSELERIMNEIEEGKKDYKKVLKELYEEIKRI